MCARFPESHGSRQLRDRKSTRLNSSHLGISYAVFCLKKKNSWQSKSGMQAINRNISDTLKPDLHLESDGTFLALIPNVQYDEAANRGDHQTLMNTVTL